MIQAITDAVNLILLDKGLNSYVNNFTLKMKAPITQEEIDYRTDLTNRISAISNMQSLFNDVEDRGRKLAILKSLFETLNYNADIMTIIQDEIDAYYEAVKKQEEEEANNPENAEETTDTKDLAPVEETTETNDDLDLPPMPESMEIVLDKTILTEEIEENEDGILVETSEVLIEEDDLPKPEDLGDEIDFTENN
jgi:hypothetical protein